MGEVIEQGGDLFDFEKLVVHRALRVHHFGRVALVRGKSFAWGVSALFLALEFSSLSLRFQHDLRSHVLTFDRLHRAVALVLGNRSVLE